MVIKIHKILLYQDLHFLISYWLYISVDYIISNVMHTTQHYFIESKITRDNTKKLETLLCKIQVFHISLW